MSRRVPRGGPGPEWPNEPDDGQAYGDQGAQHNGYGADSYNGNGNGAPGQDQRQQRPGQYGQYGGPGRGGPADYGSSSHGGSSSLRRPAAALRGQPQPYGGQGGDRYGQQGYGPPATARRVTSPALRLALTARPGPGLRQPADADVQLPGRRHRLPGEWRPARLQRPERPNGHSGYNGDPGGYQDRRAQGNMRRYEDTQRFDEQRYQVPGQGPGGPALPGQPGQDEPAGP